MDAKADCLIEDIMKILVATDGSQFSERALVEVANRPWPAQSEIKVISVIEPPILPSAETLVMPEGFYDDMVTASESEAGTSINKAVEILKPCEASGHVITSTIVKGHPRQAIIEEAEDWQADLIILGSHGYRGLTRLLLGSVAQAVAAHSLCSVEIVRKRESPES
jgi:nucleotide-binding universal stress UspA family protein